MYPTLYRNKKDGSVVADRGCMDRIPFRLLTDPPSNKITLAAFRASPPTLMTVSAEGPMLVRKLCAQRTGVCKVFMTVQDGLRDRQPLMNAPVHVDCIFGSGQKPYPLPCGLFLDENYTVDLEVSDISNAANALWPSLEGGKLRKLPNRAEEQRRKIRLRARQYLEMPFIYTTDKDIGAVGVVSANAAAQATVTIDPRFHFELMQLSAVSTGRFSCNIINQATGESLINAPAGQNYEINDQILFGTNLFPLRLFDSWLIRGGQKLLITITDLSGADNTIYLALGGKHIRSGEER